MFKKKLLEVLLPNDLINLFTVIYHFNTFIKPYLNHFQHNVLVQSPDNNKTTLWYHPENETRDIGSSGQAINPAGGQTGQDITQHYGL